MDFAYSQKVEELRGRLSAFLDSHIYPAESVYRSQMEEAGDPHHHPQVLEDLKREARSQGLWNLFLPDTEHGGGLSVLEYAPLAEITGRSPELAPEAINCSAPVSFLILSDLLIARLAVAAMIKSIDRMMRFI